MILVCPLYIEDNLRHKLAREDLDQLLPIVDSKDKGGWPANHMLAKILDYDEVIANPHHAPQIDSPFIVNQNFSDGHLDRAGRMPA
jgi:hypothetical protein